MSEQGIFDILFQSFQENTIFWILLYIGLGAVLSESIKFIFENTIPERKRRKATIKAIKKYSIPLVDSASVLSTSLSYLINRIQFSKLETNFTEFNEKSKIDARDDYFCLNILYGFGCFLAWSRIYSKESFSEYRSLYEQKGDITAFIKQPSVGPAKGFRRFNLFYSVLNPNINKNLLFQIYFGDIFASILPTRTDLLDKYERRQTTYGDENKYPIFILEPTVPLDVIQSIADDMVISKKNGEGLISYYQFARKYNDDGYFRTSLSYLSHLLSETEPSTKSVKWNKLLFLYISLRFFEYFVVLTQRGTYKMKTPEKFFKFEDYPPIDEYTLSQLKEKYEWLTRYGRVSRLDLLRVNIYYLREYIKHKRPFKRDKYQC